MLVDTYSENEIRLNLDIVFTDNTRITSFIDVTGDTTSRVTIDNDLTKQIKLIEFRATTKQQGTLYADNISITPI